jgi:hypothetical protein
MGRASTYGIGIRICEDRGADIQGNYGYHHHMEKVNYHINERQKHFYSMMKK